MKLTDLKVSDRIPMTPLQIDEVIDPASLPKLLPKVVGLCRDHPGLPLQLHYGNETHHGKFMTLLTTEDKTLLVYWRTRDDPTRARRQVAEEACMVLLGRALQAMATRVATARAADPEATMNVMDWPMSTAWVSADDDWPAHYLGMNPEDEIHAVALIMTAVSGQAWAEMLHEVSTTILHTSKLN